MIKIILSIFIIANFLFANLTDFDYTKKDYKILKDLDIESTFIDDETLQELFSQYSKEHRLNDYVSNIKKSAVYIPKIKEELKKEGLPNSFLFMPMAESDFKIDATSESKASGLWQFIPQTAKLFNLRNDEYVDERLDFIKSTKAAAKYIYSNYERFDKWYLAILAYNCGEGRVIEAITRASIDKYLELFPEKKDSEKILGYQKIIDRYVETKRDFNKLYKVYKDIKNWNVSLDVSKLLEINDNNDRQYLPKESRIYLRKIIAFAMLGNRGFYQDEDILNIKSDAPVSSVKAKGGLNLRSIANAIDVNYDDLADINKHIKQDFIPKDVKSYSIYIPSQKLDLYNRKKNNIKNSTFITHIVKSGDSLLALGKKYNIKYGLIKDYNDLKNNTLVLNQKIIIPVEQKRIKEESIKTYEIKDGDTLGSIAKLYEIDLKKLIKDNNLESSLIKVGDKIEIYR